MECFICREVKYDFNYFCCCLNKTCTDCYKKARQCFYCRSCDFNRTTLSEKILQIIEKIELNKIEKNDYLYVSLFKNLLCKRKDELALLYGKRTNNLLINRHMGALYLRKNKPEEAKKVFIEALKIKDSYCFKELVHLYYKDLDKHIDDLKNLFSNYELTEENQNTYYCLKGHIFFQKKEYSVAKASFMKSQCKCSFKIINLHKIYKEEENFKEAENVLIKVLEKI